MCEAFDQTSTAELSEEECGPVKRVSKKKIYPGFILGTEYLVILTLVSGAGA